jgi:hypothetical protein
MINITSVVHNLVYAEVRFQLPRWKLKQLIFMAPLAIVLAPPATVVEQNLAPSQYTNSNFWR